MRHSGHVFVDDVVVEVVAVGVFHLSESTKRLRWSKGQKSKGWIIIRMSNSAVAEIAGGPVWRATAMIPAARHKSAVADFAGGPVWRKRSI